MKSEVKYLLDLHFVSGIFPFLFMNLLKISKNTFFTIVTIYVILFWRKMIVFSHRFKIASKISSSAVTVDNYWVNLFFSLVENIPVN